MAYTRYYSQGYANGSAGATPITAAALNHAEDGLVAAAATADAAIAAPASPPTSGVVYWTGAAWASAKVTDANVDAAAAIAYSKLALAGSILNNDINASAAISLSKLAGYPSDATKVPLGDGTWGAPPRTIVRGTKAASVASTGTTFAGGADVLAAALSFTADGTSTYRVILTAPSCNASAATGRISLNLDGAEAGVMAYTASSTNTPCYAAIPITPSVGAHTVNVRIYLSSAGTITLVGGSSGVGTSGPIEVRVELA